jgi:hypothetical protein
MFIHFLSKSRKQDRSSDDSGVQVSEFQLGRLSKAVLLHLFCKDRDLAFDLFVFLEFSLEEPDGDAALLFDPHGSENIGIGDLGLGAFEAFDLDKPLFGQLCETVIHLAHTDPHPLGHVALPQLGLVGQKVEEAIVNLLLEGVVHGVNLIGEALSLVKEKLVLYRYLSTTINAAGVKRWKAQQPYTANRFDWTRREDTA